MTSEWAFLNLRRSFSDICEYDYEQVTDNSGFLQVNVGLKDNIPGADTMKEMLRTKGADVIREKLACYVDSLKQGMIWYKLQSLQRADTCNNRPGV